MSLIQKLIARFLRFSSKRSAYKFIMKDWMLLSDLRVFSQVLESKRFSENLEPILMDRPQGRRVVVLAPHPDDEVLGPGGTLLQSIASGAAVKVIFITSGERENRRDIAHTREEEARGVARALGVAAEFLQYPAHTWEVDMATQERLRTAIRTWNPDTIFLPFLSDDHEDHRRASELFYSACKDTPLLCEVWAYQVYSTVLPNVIVDVTNVMEEKLRLVRMYQSQMAKRDWAHYVRGLNALNSRFLKTNEPRYAEMFFVVPALEYIELCHRYYAD